MIHRLASLIVKELIQFSRDRILLVMAFMMPIVQIYLLGNAIGQDIQNISIAVIDYDRSSLSREIIQALDNTTELTVEHLPDSLAEARALVNAVIRLSDLLPGVELPENGRTLRFWQPLSTFKAERELGLIARPFEETARDTVAWFRDHGYL